MPRTRLSAIIYLVLVFGSGILVGVASSRLYAVKASVAPAAVAPRTMEEFRARYLNEMRQKVGVNETQVTAVTAILDETKKKFDDLRKQERPMRDQIQQEQIDAIRNTLTEPQRLAYDAWRTERQKAQQARQQNKAKSTGAVKTQ